MLEVLEDSAGVGGAGERVVLSTPSVGFLRSRGTSIEAYYKVSKFFLRGSIRNQDTTVKICLLIRSAL